MTHSDENCIFCKIIKGDIPSSKIYEDEYAYSFLDIGPLADGHILLIPKNHYANMSDMPADEIGAVTSLIPKLSNALLNVTGATGFNLLCNQGESAGQVVMHVHFHMIPRKENDGLGYRWNAGKYTDAQRDAIMEKFSAALN